MPAVLALETSLDHDLTRAVDARLARMDADQVIPRIWRGDHTVWSPDPTEIADRLGWLTAPHTQRSLLPEVRALAQEAAAEGLTHALLLGMGGSSLAPEVFRRALGVAPGALDLRVLDSTHPDAIAAVEAEVPLDHTLFVVSSKSGSTIETRSHLAYFAELIGDASRFVAITDPGSPLETEASSRGFRRVIPARPDVGGRYSALTAFGLLPAALIGADLDVLLASAADAAESCGGANRPLGNPGAALGAIMGEAAVAGHDKLTIRAADPLAPVGSWLEQLIAESTGKEGKGIVPIDLEPVTPPGAADRLHLSLGAEPPPEPWARIPLGAPESLGAVMFLLEFATAVAGHVLGVQPFDQPDVQSAKDRTAAALAGSGNREAEPPGDLDALLGSVKPSDYVAIQAFVPPAEDTWVSLQGARGAIGARLNVATTLGYGPRYLHSTGQLHKGGPATGVFVQVVQEAREDREIPGAGYSFGRLIEAQADGDLAALRERGHRVARVSLDTLLEWSTG